MTVTCRPLIGRAYLCRGHVVFERVHGEAEDVVVVAEVKPLTVLQPVVNDGNGGHMVHHLPCLTVEQVVTTVKASIPAQTGDKTATIKVTIGHFIQKSTSRES